MEGFSLCDFVAPCETGLFTISSRLKGSILPTLPGRVPERGKRVTYERHLRIQTVYNAPQSYGEKGKDSPGTEGPDNLGECGIHITSHIPVLSKRARSRIYERFRP